MDSEEDLSSNSKEDSCSREDNNGDNKDNRDNNSNGEE